ncbi:hypothetical protein CTAYLR_008273 [Chrysophaeum taylorii]|uniref:Fungal lipase-type domain-containing protein n=1 Tax=Chrysophaeum taylorii TaxID=2483200 RepID=A0AAD7UAS3_9STRA|nr:hypothetical protein CTAYLR_008273 [Chrysophaeum taylorii]
MVFLGLMMMIGAAGAYDESTAIRALQLSEAAYCTGSVSENSSLPEGATVTAVVSQTTSGGRAIVGYDTFDETVFVAYRGSENVQNWIENIKFIKTYPYEGYPDVGVEQGFYDWYADLNDAGLLDAVKELASYSSNLKVTGHSAGAACATLLATDVSLGLALTDFDLVSATTFGSPRVGQSDFADLYATFKHTSLRVTHYHDIVPHLPPEDMTFHHVATEVFYNEANSAYKVCDGSGEDNSCSNACADTFSCTSVDDHLYYINITLGVDGCPSSNRPKIFFHPRAAQKPE